MNIYEKCPVFENEQYLIRLMKMEDASDLLDVYSDKQSLPYFNSDNCNGNFYITKEEDMKNAIKYWLIEYENKNFVRFSIYDKKRNRVIGSIELFHRIANDYFTHCGLLRLDLASHYETKEAITTILSLIIKPTFMLFEVNRIATKAPNYAVERIAALQNLKFTLSLEYVAGFHGEKKYYDYWELRK